MKHMHKKMSCNAKNEIQYETGKPLKTHTRDIFCFHIIDIDTNILLISLVQNYQYIRNKFFKERA